jgi:hypothetical protein
MQSPVVVARIRPVSWKVCVQGHNAAEHVRRLLAESGCDCSKSLREPELQDIPIYSFSATPRTESPLTAPELQAILDQDRNIKVAFDT